MGAVTAPTARDTRGVSAVHTPAVPFLRRQLDAVSDDVTISAVTIGMLGSAAIAECVAGWLDDVAPPAVVLDPVMVATSGARLLDDDAVRAVLELARRASLVTPNIAEPAVLVGAGPAPTRGVALEQGTTFAVRLGTSVLVKGGHVPGERCPDAPVPPSGAPEERLVVDGRRVGTVNTHRTGCPLSSAPATRFAITGDWPTALREAKSWLEGALLSAHRPTGRRKPARRPLLLLPAALHLREYAGVLARTAAPAPSEAERRFCLAAAASCLGNETDLHRDRLLRETGTGFGDGDAGPAGARPYGAWIATYADPDVVEAMARAARHARRLPVVRAPRAALLRRRPCPRPGTCAAGCH